MRAAPSNLRLPDKIEKAALVTGFTD